MAKTWLLRSHRKRVVRILITKIIFDTTLIYGGCRLLVCVGWAWSRLSYAQILGDSELFSGLEEEEDRGPHALPSNCKPWRLPKNYTWEWRERRFKHSIFISRRVLENAFGVIANKFRCLLRTQVQKPNTARINSGSVWPTEAKTHRHCSTRDWL